MMLIRLIFCTHIGLLLTAIYTISAFPVGIFPKVVTGEVHNGSFPIISDNGNEETNNPFQYYTNLFRSYIFPSPTSSPENGNQISSVSNLLSRLAGPIIIDSNSLSHIQIYNSDLLEDSENNSTPNAIFGSPLCFGLCLTSQVYSENSSYRLLSDKQFSLVETRSTNDVKVNRSPDSNYSKMENVGGGKNLEPSTSSESSVFHWLPSWFSSPLYLPSQLSLQEFRNLPSRISGVLGK